MKWQHTMLAFMLATVAGGAARSATLLHYDFSNNGGTTVTDLSGNGRNGTLEGFSDSGASAGAFGVSEGWVTGGGLSFLDDAVRSYVATPLSQSTLVANGSFTIEFRASANNPTGWTPAVSRENNYGNTVFLGLDGWGNSTIYAGIGGPEGSVGTCPWALPRDGSDPASHHVALVFTKNPSGTGGVFEGFVDGVSSGTLPTTDNLVVGSPNFRIGNSGDAAAQWDGVIHGVAFSDQALPPSSFVLLGTAKEFMMLVGAGVNIGSTKVGTLRTSGDYPAASYAISGGSDADMFEWATPGSPDLHLKVAAAAADLGKQYCVQVTATDTAPTPKSVKVMIEVSVVSTGGGTTLILR